MAAPFGFHKIVGVEFMPEWHRVAQENIRKFAAANPSTPPIESLCMDARDFDFPHGPLVVYLFNPFPEALFAAIINNLRQSINRTSRIVYVAYRFPEFDNLLMRTAWLSKIAGTQQWSLYKS